MCGLIAAFFPDSIDPPTRDEVESRLEQSLETIKYRGPDSRGTYVSPDAHVGLGHVRLAIIDLPTGQQPLSDEEGLIHCVVTGEIYDHERIRAEMQSQGYLFASLSDSELVVQLYKRDGFNLVQHLRGEFAFVLYDLKRRLLFVARDRFGIKPLYYTVHNGCIMFASEMKAFMSLGWHAEWDIDSIVHNGDFGDERTVFRGVQKLPAGYLAVCRASGHMQTQAYWDITYPAATAPPAETIASMTLRVRELLVEAVRLRLRADVPLAVYLSGGIDSSCVAGIATHLLREKDPSARVTAFTMAYIEDPATDESPLAERTAAHINADLRRVDATEARLVDVFEESVWHAEQLSTSFHGAGKLLLAKAVRDAGFKVVLSGEGSDEIFGGYPWFPLDFLQSADPAGAALGIPLPSEAERRVMAAEYHAATRMPFRPHSAIKSNGPRPLISTGSHLAVHNGLLGSTAFNPEVVARTGVPDTARCIEEGIDARVREHSVTGHWHPLNVSMYTSAKTVLGKSILNIVGDRSDMTHSVESRPAFLDHHLVDYVTTLPPSLKIMPIAGIAGAPPGKWQMVEKWILRQAVKPFITEEVYMRKKVAFNPPPAGPPPPGASQTLLPLQTHLKARITQASVARLGFVSWPYIEEQLSAYLASPTFLPNGGIDGRAKLLLNVLSHIVLQERFDVPSYKV
ncbi:putative asparagine synthase [Mycena pura]|uniref:Asparagine synthase n=1 Tax=Mycena pura TaxID=153505 RepID=A0AAD6YVA1_9AGAR|nr:putative asparagine synthase [Mycena pura]